MVKQKLSRVVEWYNYIIEKTEKCELDILAAEVAAIDVLLIPGLDTQNWDAYGKFLRNIKFYFFLIYTNILHIDPTYVEKIYEKLKDIYERVIKSQANVEKILKHIDGWGTKPLFERKDQNNEALLDIANRDELLNSRLKQCIESKRLIDKIIIEDNFRLFFNMPSSCPCSSDEEEEEDLSDAENQTEDKAGGTVEATGKVSQKAQTEDTLNADVKKLKEAFVTQLVKTGEQLNLYRPYEEYIDQLVADKIMNAIVTRFGILLRKKKL